MNPGFKLLQRLSSNALQHQHRRLLKKPAAFPRLLPIIKPHFSKTARSFTTTEKTLKPFKIRNMALEDLKTVMGWAKELDWNPGKHEVEALYAADPSGYWILEVEGVPAASLAGVKHSRNFAFLGLYIVKEEFRGQGYGKLLWDAVMENLKSYPTIGLNGVIEQIGNYKKSGFSSTFKISRWRGVPYQHRLDEALDDINHVPLTSNFSLKDLVEYDARIFSTLRAAFLEKWIKMPESHVLAAIENGKLKGYGVMSKTVDGFKVAPLFADDELTAKKLFAALSKCTKNQGQIHFDTTEINTFASPLARHFGLQQKFDTMRMYKGPQPSSDEQRTVGLTTLEIG